MVGFKEGSVLIQAFLSTSGCFKTFSGYRLRISGMQGFCFFLFLVNEGILEFFDSLY
jgi:hypothetical protein